MPKMTKEDNPEAFLEIFERAAIASGFDKVRWAGQLRVLLVEQAQTVYCARTRIVAQDYDKVKNGILQRFNITLERH